MAKHRKRRDPDRQEPKAPRPSQPNSDNNHRHNHLNDEELRRLSAALGEEFEIVGPEDEVWDEPSQPITPSISLEELLRRLIHHNELPPLHELYALSDLSLEGM